MNESALSTIFREGNEGKSTMMELIEENRKGISNKIVLLVLLVDVRSMTHLDNA